MQNLLLNLAYNLEANLSFKRKGKVLALHSNFILAQIPEVATNDLCSISCTNGKKSLAIVTCLEGKNCRLLALDDTQGIKTQSEIISYGTPLGLSLNKNYLGQVLDSLGEVRPNSTDGPNISETFSRISIINHAPCPLQRKFISERFSSGIKSIDLFSPIGVGQKIGLFASPGVGKSTLLGMLARNSEAEITIVALIGERGREVKEFIEQSLGESGLKKSIVVASTSDESPLRRVTALQTATRLAEHYRSLGKKVLLLVDSLTRVARAIRDIGLANGEMPIRQGYTPSVYTELPKFLERTGNNQQGSITAIYTILTSFDQESDPLAEEIKSLLDGHLVLSSELANQGIRPAIDILRSISRLTQRLQTKDQRLQSEIFKQIFKRLQTDKDIILIGGNADNQLKVILKLEAKIISLLSQEAETSISFSSAENELQKFLEDYRQELEKCN